MSAAISIEILAISGIDEILRVWYFEDEFCFFKCLVV